MAHKTPPKALKKGSKLASLKSAIFGAAKKKAAATATARGASPKAPAKPEKAAPKAVDKKALAAVANAKNLKKGAIPHTSGKGAAAVKGTGAASAKTAPVKVMKGAAPAKAAAASGKKGAAVPATPAPGPLLRKPAKKTKVEVVQERHAGPSIRISYDSNGEAVCREVACEGLGTSAGYCRMHYIKNWKKIKRKELILKEGKLNQYIEELVTKYPDKYIEAIREDLANDKDFAKVIYDLDLDESSDDFDAEGESMDSLVDNIKRDFDDDGDTGF